MGCASSHLLNHDEDFTKIGSSALGHHIVSLTSTTYGLLTLDTLSSKTKTHVSPTLVSIFPTPQPQPVSESLPEVINSWELMAGLDPTAESFRLYQNKNLIFQENSNLDYRNLITQESSNLDHKILISQENSKIDHKNPFFLENSNLDHKNMITQEKSILDHKNPFFLENSNLDHKNMITQEKSNFDLKNPIFHENSNLDHQNPITKFFLNIDDKDPIFCGNSNLDHKNMITQEKSNLDLTNPIFHENSNLDHKNPITKFFSDIDDKDPIFRETSNLDHKKLTTQEKSNLDEKIPIFFKPNALSLDEFENLCPPKGENKIVVYSTTLRGVRKTFEACNAVRTVLEGYGVFICERDISMDQGFKAELRELLKGKDKVELVPPRVFVKRRYIGGVEEVLKRMEEGSLGKLVEGLPKSKGGGYVCDGCGGVRFLPCFRCNGSCKMVQEGRKRVVVRCGECNENGLVHCPICS